MHLSLPGALNEDTRPSTERQRRLALPRGIRGKSGPEGGRWAAACRRRKYVMDGKWVEAQWFARREWGGKELCRVSLGEFVRALWRICEALWSTVLQALGNQVQVIRTETVLRSTSILGEYVGWHQERSPGWRRGSVQNYKSSGRCGKAWTYSEVLSLAKKFIWDFPQDEMEKPERTFGPTHQ